MESGGESPEVAHPEAVTLRSGRGGLLVTAIGLAGFVALAIAAIALNGLNAVTGMIAVAACGASIVILLDVPVSVTFDERGIRRSTPLRRHVIEWSEVDRLVRMRRSGIRLPGSDRFRGIVAVRGRKRTVLVDRTEDAEETVRLVVLLRTVLEDHAHAALLVACRSTTSEEQGAELDHDTLRPRPSAPDRPD